MDKLRPGKEGWTISHGGGQSQAWAPAPSAPRVWDGVTGPQPLCACPFPLPFFLSSFKAMDFKHGIFCSPGNIWHCLETFVMVTLGRGLLALVGIGQGCCWPHSESYREPTVAAGVS
jgi:hypothetical protein